ncbi:MAG: HIT domain-containing protein [Bryobacterales bacterium]|nr:HIT domain-containing protein [Bryobacterales bacterium]
MDHLWSPWRYQYVQKKKSGSECVLCCAALPGRDEENLVVHRARKNYVILNRYPYSTGHLMIVPYRHMNTLQDASQDTLEEMMLLVQKSQGLLQQIYQAPGFNLGMNLGESAGAGIAEHIHMHVLPRWPGDTNFMTTVGETRVLPEDLAVTWRKLSEAFEKA